jgi:hypothetical protein
VIGERMTRAGPGCLQRPMGLCVYGSCAADGVPEAEPEVVAHDRAPGACTILPHAVMASCCDCL